MFRQAFSHLFNRTAEVDPSGNISITPRQIYIVPTMFGFTFGIMLLGMLVGSNNYGINLGFILTFLLAGIGLSAMLQTWRNLTHLKIMPAATDSVFMGDMVNFSLYCRNERTTSRSGLQFKIGENVIACDIAANEACQVDCPVLTTSRGQLDPGRWTLFSYFPLGMFYAWAYFGSNQVAIVYPRPVDPDIPLSQLFHATFIDRFIQDDSGDFHGHRKYQPGDSPGRMDWKAMARGRGTLVKEFSREKTDDLWIDYDDVIARGMEERLSVLCRAVLELSREDIRFGMRLSDQEIQPDSGAIHRSNCLEHLALFGK